jgi:phospholipid/cholesterol/gamma-HCH transport system substrate-binding protein
MEKEQVKQDNTSHNKSKLKVGIFCIAAVVIFYLGACFFKGVSAFGKKTYYYAVFENTGGLQESNAVMLNGYKIGQVTKVSLLSDNPVRLCAELMITEPVNIPKDSKVQVAPKDLLGGTVVNILFGNDTHMLQAKDTMATYVVPQMTDGIDGLKAQLASILTSVDTIALSLKDVMSPEGGAQDLKGTLANLEATTANLNSILGNNKDKVGKLVTNLEKFSNNLQEAGPQLETIVNNLDKISDSVAKANVTQLINDAQQAIGDVQLIVNKIQKGDGTLGQLVTNDTLYSNLENSLHSLDELLKDLKANPKKYINVTVFGKKEKKEKN